MPYHHSGHIAPLLTINKLFKANIAQCMAGGIFYAFIFYLINNGDNACCLSGCACLIVDALLLGVATVLSCSSSLRLLASYNLLSFIPLTC